MDDPREGPRILHLRGEEKKITFRTLTFDVISRMATVFQVKWDEYSDSYARYGHRFRNDDDDHNDVDNDFMKEARSLPPRHPATKSKAIIAIE